MRDGQHLTPDFAKFVSGAGILPAVGQAESLPHFQKQFDVLQHCVRGIRAQTIRRGLGMPVEDNQNIGGEREKLF